MSPKEELYDEIIIATSLYKEALEELDEILVVNKTSDDVVRQVHEARDYLFSFLEMPHYENFS